MRIAGPDGVSMQTCDKTLATKPALRHNVIVGAVQ
jgi:hypothetical protein